MAFLQYHFYSSALGKDTKMNAVLPVYTSISNQEIPICLLLHGIHEDHSHWIRHTKVETLAQLFQIGVFMPQIPISFYKKSPNSWNVQKYLIHELPKILNTTFPFLSKFSKNHLIAAKDRCSPYQLQMVLTQGNYFDKGICLVNQNQMQIIEKNCLPSTVTIKNPDITGISIEDRFLLYLFSHFFPCTKF